MVGTPLFMAPEVMAPAVSRQDQAGYGKKADVWSFGILAAEVLDQGNMPWPDFAGPGQAFVHICSEGVQPTVSDAVPVAAAAFVLRCCQRDPMLRPSMAEVLADPWLQLRDAPVVPTDSSTAEALAHDTRCAAVAAGRYQKGKIIGRGAAGAVYSVMLADGSTVAMKEMPMGGADEAAMLAQVEVVEREMALLSTLQHPHVIVYFGVVADRQNYVLKLFMELMTGGSLGALIRGMAQRLGEATVVAFMRRIVEGVCFIHEHGVLHRDLKADNVLIDPATGNVKLSEFGTAKAVANATQTAHAASTMMVGTPLFMAPEVISPASTEPGDALGYGKKADVWSLGIMAAEVLDRGNVPWPAFAGAGQALLHISGAAGVPVVPDNVSAAAGDFIRRCTQRDPADRPSAADLLDDPWLSFMRQDTADLRGAMSMAVLLADDINLDWSSSSGDDDSDG
jgi:serine/threonine protein kinase